jgi:hypothetical protein
MNVLVVKHLFVRLEDRPIIEDLSFELALAVGTVVTLSEDLRSAVRGFQSLTESFIHARHSRNRKHHRP